MSKKVCISGGADPIHDGHLDMIEDASQYGDVIVILNSDDWLIRKKGFCFFNWQTRARLLASIRGVAGIIAVDDSDGTVCEALERLKPDYFANGGDRGIFNTPEVELCARLGIEMLWNIGGGKVNSSSEIAKRAIVHRKWGTYLTLDEGEKYKVKRLVIKPEHGISLQKHLHRTEDWTIISGMARIRIGKTTDIYQSNQSVFIDKGTVHQITNVSEFHPLIVIETQVGDYLGEDDIIRLS
jgi:cytidyltransferase-like protein